MKAEDHFLDLFFNPQSIAIIGATDDADKINYPLMKNLCKLGFKGRIYPISKKNPEIMGYKSYPGLRSVPDKIDLVISAIPATKTIKIAKECNDLGIKRLVIISGGFSEGGDDGQKLHEQLLSFIQEKGIHTLGPNTLSPVNTKNNFAISYHLANSFKKGGLSFAFQSGFYEPKIASLMGTIGLNKVLDMGNKMDINEVDALEYFLLDPATKIIAMHIESLRGDARKFLELLREVSIKKPTIILKSGRTSSGSKAASSHTGSIARENDLIFDGMIKQTAAIRAQNIEEFFDLAKAFEFLPLPEGNRLSIIPFSGGEGVMSTDACEMNGLKMASLSNKAYKRLHRIFPPWDIPLNPFDLGVCAQFFSDLESFFDCLCAIPEDEGADFAIMQMPPPVILRLNRSGHGSIVDEYSRLILKMKKPGKPFALWSSSMDIPEMNMIDNIEANRVPVFPSAVRAVKALATLYQFNVKKNGRS